MKENKAIYIFYRDPPKTIFGIKVRGKRNKLLKKLFNKHEKSNTKQIRGFIQAL